MTDKEILEKEIEKIKKLQQKFTIWLKLLKLKRKVFHFGKNKSAREIFIETPYGNVRSLGYGFENTEKSPIFFDLHGGGFVFGVPELDEKMNLEIMHKVPCKILSIDYPKAPAHPFPTTINQIYAVIKHVYNNAENFSINNKKMAIGGHSSGANLSTVICLMARDEGELSFLCQVLDYPPLDLATSPYNKPNPKGGIPPETASAFDACYRDPSQAKNPYVSPIYTPPERLKHLPPALIIVAGKDSLHDEGLLYGKMLKDSGIEVECLEYPDAPHGFTYKNTSDSTDALGHITAFLKKHLTQESI